MFLLINITKDKKNINVKIVIIIVNPKTIFEDHPKIIDVEKNFTKNIQMIRKILNKIPINEKTKNLIKISS